MRTSSASTPRAPGTSADGRQTTERSPLTAHVGHLRPPPRTLYTGRTERWIRSPPVTPNPTIRHGSPTSSLAGTGRSGAPPVPPATRHRTPLLGISIALVAILAGSGLFLSGYSLGRQAASEPGTAPSDEAAFQPFWDTYHTISDRYAGGEIDRGGLVQGAIKGMIDSLGDPSRSTCQPTSINRISRPSAASSRASARTSDRRRRTEPKAAIRSGRHAASWLPSRSTARPLPGPA